MKLHLSIFLASFLLIASCSKTTAPTAEKAAPAVASGAEIFAKSCQRCHGAEGIKDSRTPNLQTIALDKAGLVKSITNGKNNMPAFGEKLSAAEISAVADLIVGWHNK
jgi:mono/diheme cytochrome c family protein